MVTLLFGLVLFIGHAKGDEIVLEKGVALGKIALTVSQLDSTKKGDVVVSLFKGKDHWLSREHAVKVVQAKVTSSDLKFAFESLTPGDYALSVFHDENGNNKLDMKWFPIPGPNEGSVVSREIRPKFGPPSYNDAVFSVAQEEISMTLRMVYP